MSTGETVRALATQRNVRRADDLVAKLDAIKSQELRSAQDLVTAFRPLVETVADLLRDVSQMKGDTADLLDRLETALNKLEVRMLDMPEQMERASRATVESLAARLEKLAEAMNSVGRRATAQVQETVTGMLTANRLASERAEKRELAMEEALQEIRTTARAAREDAEKAGRRRFVGPLLMTVGAAVLSSISTLLAVSWMMGSAALRARLLGQ